MVAAIFFEAGAETPQGAENSAVKKTAPFSVTPLRISENASISRSGHIPGDLTESAVRASETDAQSFPPEQGRCTIVFPERKHGKFRGIVGGAWARRKYECQ
jgi:hypothetical protein